MLGALAVLSVLLLVFHYLPRIFRRKQPPPPPGPKPWPIIGNALDVPTSRPWEVYSKWSKDYGENFFVAKDLYGCSCKSGSDVIYLSALGTNVIVLDSFKAAVDLLEKRSQMYSDRVPNVMCKL